MTFGERFRQARQANGHTQEQAAQALHVSISAVRAWERKSPPPAVPRMSLIHETVRRYIEGGG